MNEQIITLLGIAIRTVALGFLYFSILPKMHAESRINDGIRDLRRRIYWGGIIYAISGAVFLVVNTLRVFALIDGELSYLLALIASISTLLISIILYLIYTSDYGKLKP